MLIRLFLIAFILVLVGRTVRAFLGKGPSQSREISPTPLVHDPVCGLYVDRDRALVAKSPSGEPVYFCSQTCRDKYLAPPSPESSPPPLLPKQRSE